MKFTEYKLHWADFILIPFVLVLFGAFAIAVLILGGDDRDNEEEEDV